MQLVPCCKIPLSPGVAGSLFICLAGFAVFLEFLPVLEPPMTCKLVDELLLRIPKSLNLTGAFSQKFENFPSWVHLTGKQITFQLFHSFNVECYDFVMRTCTLIVWWNLVVEFQNLGKMWVHVCGCKWKSIECSLQVWQFYYKPNALYHES